MQARRRDYDPDSHELQASLADAQLRARKLQQMLRTESDRRLEEELRALLEGAPFVIHRTRDRMLRYVWLADAPKKKRAVIRWQSERGKKWRKLAPGSNRAALAREPPFHEVGVESFVSVSIGHDLFPEVQSRYYDSGRRVDSLDLDHDKCFSISLQVPAKSGQMAQLALHLEVPPGGNGRSRSEWVSAFSSLMLKKLPLYRPDSGNLQDTLEQKLQAQLGSDDNDGGEDN